MANVLCREWQLKPSAPSDQDQSHRPSLDPAIGKTSHHLELALPGQVNLVAFKAKIKEENSVLDKFYS